MQYLGTDNSLDNQIRDKVTISNYTIISFLDDFFKIDINQYRKLILLLPYTEQTVWDSQKIATNRMIDDSLYDNRGNCINIFVVEPSYHRADTISSVINNVDKKNQVDNIWLYPNKTSKPILRRNNIIDELPYQQQ
jgi:hypothetical protein